MTPGLLRAWRATEYRVAGAGTVRIGRRPDAVLGRLGIRGACLLGADNPGSRRMPEGWNRRMRSRLAAWLRGVPTWPASGVGRGWQEAHVLAALPPARAHVLARRFRQAASVVLRRGQPASLVIVRASQRVRGANRRGA